MADEIQSHGARSSSWAVRARPPTIRTAEFGSRPREYRRSRRSSRQSRSDNGGGDERDRPVVAPWKYVSLRDRSPTAGEGWRCAARQGMRSLFGRARAPRAAYALLISVLTMMTYRRSTPSLTSSSPRPGRFSRRRGRGRDIREAPGQSTDRCDPAGRRSGFILTADPILFQVELRHEVRHCTAPCREIRRAVPAPSMPCCANRCFTDGSSMLAATAIQFRNDVGRRPGRRHDAEPEHHVDVGQALLGEGLAPRPSSAPLPASPDALPR